MKFDTLAYMIPDGDGGDDPPESPPPPPGTGD
jgi:hypothetical protein